MVQGLMFVNFRVPMARETPNLLPKRPPAANKKHLPPEDGM